jgi:hypothetical protein
MSRKIVLNSLLLSILINFLIILLPSIFFAYKEFPHPSKKDEIPAELFSLPKGKISGRLPPNQSDQVDKQDSYGLQSESKDLTTRTYKSILRELASSSKDPTFESRLKELGIDRPSNINQNIESDSKPPTSTVKLNANITGTGKNATGYYNIMPIKYKGSSDNVSINVLKQLATAMNKWTNIKTQVLQKSASLDNPDIIRLPMISLASRKAFTFTDLERANLRRYIASGGLVVFSNTADSDVNSQDVSNSVGFELWNILGEIAHNLSVIDKDSPIYNSFFDLRRSQLPDLFGLVFNGKIAFIYDDSGYAIAWSKGMDNENAPFMKMGVNIIVSNLATD